jgi:hypothetical protein
MLIWTGWGFAVPVVAFASLILAELAANAYFDDEFYYAENGWPKAVGMFLAAALLWFLGQFLHRDPGRTVIDKETGQELVIRRTHTFFWIRVEYWALILVVVGVVVLVLDL